jgi:peptidoglycan/LPS O-acetylase OafA/YrhL
MITDVHPQLDAPAAYRADIDGLRAIAVLSVVLYHALPLWLPGGFVGVDVFFVISGFLITRLLVERLAGGRFDVIDFYVRRIKRIFPALLLVLAVSYAFGWWVLLADEFKQLGGHVAGGAGFVANLVLWHEAGYFDNASETKPLLHLWSLGIEEQFYLVWPWLLWAAHRWRWPLLPLIAVLALLSFAVNVATVERDAVAAFYAPQARCWELFAGALLACGTPHGQFSARLRGIGLLGLALLVASLYFIKASRPFPGYWAVLPVLGAVLIIAAGPRAWTNRVLLSSRPMVWFGLISYPLYLWHWPLLSFARIVGHQQLDASLAVAAVELAVLLAWLTYRLVERPLRYGLAGERPAAVLLAAMVAMGVLGYGSYAAQGLPFRPVAVTNATNAALLDWQFFHTPDCDRVWGQSMNFCLGFGDVTAPRVVVLGDSTANSLAPGLGVWVAGKGDGLVNVGSYGCPPVRGMSNRAGWRNGQDCIAGMQRAYAQVAASPSVKLVVLALFARDLKDWNLPGVALNAPQEKRFEIFKALLEADIKFLRAAGKRVVVSYDMPFANTDARVCLPRPLSAWLTRGASACDAPEESLHERQPYQGLFDAYFAGRDDVCVFRQSELLIRDGRLRFVDEQGLLLLRDDHHLTSHGSTRMAELFARRCGASQLAP